MTNKVLLTPEELRALPQGEVVIIDTRTPDAYAAGHIPGAVNLHEIFTYLSTSTPQGLAEMRGKFAEAFGAAGLSGKETAVCVEESMTSGFGQSCRGYFLLSWLGYAKATVLHGGMEAWKAAGMPVDTQAVTPTRATFPLTEAGSDMMVDRDAMLAAVGDATIVKLDVRDVDEWIGASSSPYGADFCPRKGRIPGATWLEWYRMMKPTPEGPVFKSGPEVLAECQTVGITKESTVYVYCFKGARAANTLVALREAGVSNVRVYFGSWNEWSRDERLPVESGLPYAVAAEPRA